MVGTSSAPSRIEVTYRRQVTPELAADLRAWRLAAGLSQRELADRVGVSRVMVCLLELGRRAPSVRTGVAIGMVLRLSDASRRRILEQSRLAGRSSPYKTGDWA
jgi:transcriptional regulator with XRE-family HTH domain